MKTERLCTKYLTKERNCECNNFVIRILGFGVISMS